MRILVTGGGSAGHISPVLATVDALKQLDSSAEILYVGQMGSMESKIARSVGLKFAAIPAGKLRRYKRGVWRNVTDLNTLWLNLRDGVRVAGGVWQSSKIIRQFQPDVIFCKGGYVSLPVGLAARLNRKRYVIHESDVDPGLTNKVLAGGAVAIAVGFPIQHYKNWSETKLIYTGNPVRRKLLSRHRLEGLSKFGLDENLPVVLVMGGSQGAAAVNDAVVSGLSKLLEFCQVLHIAGERDIERVRFQSGRLDLDYPERYKAYSFLSDELGMAYAAADLVVSRAGANSIAELAALAKPTILVPAAHLHDQPHNAQVLARSGAVKVIQDERLSGESLVNTIKQVLASVDEQRLLSEAMKQFGTVDADRRLAELILKVGSAGTRGED